MLIALAYPSVLMFIISPVFFGLVYLNGLVADHLLSGCCRISAAMDEEFASPTAGYGLPQEGPQSNY